MPHVLDGATNRRQQQQQQQQQQQNNPRPGGSVSGRATTSAKSATTAPSKCSGHEDYDGGRSSNTGTTPATAAASDVTTFPSARQGTSASSMPRLATLRSPLTSGVIFPPTVRFPFEAAAMSSRSIASRATLPVQGRPVNTPAATGGGGGIGRNTETYNHPKSAIGPARKITLPLHSSKLSSSSVMNSTVIHSQDQGDSSSTSSSSSSSSSSTSNSSTTTSNTANNSATNNEPKKGLLLLRKPRRVKGMVRSDGCILPSVEPRRERQGGFRRPAGRKPVGMVWDKTQGLWIPSSWSTKPTTTSDGVSQSRSTTDPVDGTRRRDNVSQQGNDDDGNDHGENDDAEMELFVPKPTNKKRRLASKLSPIPSPSATTTSNTRRAAVPQFVPHSRSQWNEPEREDGLTLYERNRQPRPVVRGRIRCSLRALLTEFRCVICLGCIRNARIVVECLHRFCEDCIEKSFRVGRNQCPICRVVIPSRRSLAPDPAFDNLVQCILGLRGMESEYAYAQYDNEEEHRDNAMKLQRAIHRKKIESHSTPATAAAAAAGNGANDHEGEEANTANKDNDDGGNHRSSNDSSDDDKDGDDRPVGNPCENVEASNDAVIEDKAEDDEDADNKIGSNDGGDVEQGDEVDSQDADSDGSSVQSDTEQETSSASTGRISSEGRAGDILPLHTALDIALFRHPDDESRLDELELPYLRLSETATIHLLKRFLQQKLGLMEDIQIGAFLHPYPRHVILTDWMTLRSVVESFVTADHRRGEHPILQLYYRIEPPRIKPNRKIIT